MNSTPGAVVPSTVSTTASGALGFARAVPARPNVRGVGDVDAAAQRQLLVLVRGVGRVVAQTRQHVVERVAARRASPMRALVSIGTRTVSVTSTSPRRTSAKPTAFASVGSNGGVDVASVWMVSDATSVAGKSTRCPSRVSDVGSEVDGDRRAAVDDHAARG